MRGCGTAEDDPAGDDHNPYRQPLSGEWTWKDDSLEIGGMEKRKWSGT